MTPGCLALDNGVRSEPIDVFNLRLRHGFRRSGWALLGVTPLQVACFQCGQRYHILPAYDWNGVVLSRVFQGTTNASVDSATTAFLNTWHRLEAKVVEIRNGLRMFSRPLVPPGYTRITWICVSQESILFYA